MKCLLKSAADRIAGILTLPCALGYWLGRAFAGSARAFAFWSQLMSLLPGMIGIYLRRAFYRWVLPRCDEDASIGFGTVLSHPTARIGRTVYVGPFCVLGEVTLEQDVLISSHVSIINGSRQHGIERLDVPVREQPGQWPHITIGRDSWIGDRAVILADVGRHCVVGAGSVVTRPLPDFAVALGVPASIVRYRNDPASPTAEQAAAEITAAGPWDASS